MKKYLNVLLLCFAGCVAMGASATPIAIVESGKLVGATGVMVNGVSYDVEFVDGTCIGVFSGCNPSLFAFNTMSDATTAAEALLNQVFSNAFAGGLYDVNPGILSGCNAGTDHCDVVTLYAFATDVVVKGVAAMNYWNSEVDYTYNAAAHIAMDTGYIGNVTYAKWATSASAQDNQVPEPSTLWLTGAAFALLAFSRRKWVNRV